MSPAALPTRVLLLQRTDANKTPLSSTALCLSASVDDSMKGTQGEPALELVTLNPHHAHQTGNAEWHHSLTRVGDVVHHSHPDWIEGRASRAYDTVDVGPVETVDLLTKAAQAAHEGNRILCAMTGDTTHLPWEETPADIQASSLFGAGVIEKRPNNTPAQQHGDWMAYKLAEGWKHGPVRDAEAKTHPALLPYDKLPIQQQVKDWLYGAIVRAVLGLPQLKAGNVPVLPLLASDLSAVPTDQLEELAKAIHEHGDGSTRNVATVLAASKLVRDLAEQRNGYLNGTNPPPTADPNMVTLSVPVEEWKRLGEIVGKFGPGMLLTDDQLLASAAITIDALGSKLEARTPNASEEEDDEEDDDGGTEIHQPAAADPLNTPLTAEQQQADQAEAKLDQADNSQSPGHPTDPGEGGNAIAEETQPEPELVTA